MRSCTRIIRWYSHIDSQNEHDALVEQEQAYCHDIVILPVYHGVGVIVFDSSVSKESGLQGVENLGNRGGRLNIRLVIWRVLSGLELLEAILTRITSRVQVLLPSLFVRCVGGWHVDERKSNLKAVVRERHVVCKWWGICGNSQNEVWCLFQIHQSGCTRTAWSFLVTRTLSRKSKYSRPAVCGTCRVRADLDACSARSRGHGSLSILCEVVSVLLLHPSWVSGSS